jgi:hypothetical protein
MSYRAHKLDGIEANPVDNQFDAGRSDEPEKRPAVNVAAAGRRQILTSKT